MPHSSLGNIDTLETDIRVQFYPRSYHALNPTPVLDPLFQEDSALYQATVHSIAGKIAFGPRAGHYVRRLGKGFGYDEEVPLAKGKRCF